MTEAFICAFSLAFSLVALGVSAFCAVFTLRRRTEPEGKHEAQKEERREESDAERRAREETEKFYKGLSNLLAYDGTPQNKEGG